VVRRFFLPSEPPPVSNVDARRQWTTAVIDELWEEACKHGEVERIMPLLDGDAIHPTEGCLAIRFESVLGAAAAVDALDGRFFAERSLAAAFDDGRACRTLPAEVDQTRQQRFGFGEVAQAYQDSMRVLRLAAAEGAPFIACAQFVCDVEHYEFRAADGAADGPGYYRRDDAPPPDPYEQARAILSRARDAGAAFIACAEPIDGYELPLYEYRSGPDGLGYYRHAAAPPPADPVEQARLILREAAAAGASFVRCGESVGELTGYDFRLEGEAGADEGAGYYRRADAAPPDAHEYSRIILQRASAAGAEFVACAEAVMQLPGYEHRDGPDGVGYYRLGSQAHALQPPETDVRSSGGGGAFDDFMTTMKELGAV
jgi:hypothetical protein